MRPSINGYELCFENFQNITQMYEKVVRFFLIYSTFNKIEGIES